MIVKFGADTTGFATGMAGMLGMMGNWQAAAIGAGVAISAVLIKAGVDAVNMASEFERNSLRIQTTAGLTGGTVDQLRNDMIRMSNDTGVALQDMIPPMYNVVSAYHDIHAAETIMTAALHGANTEQASYMDTTQALVTVMENFNIPFSQADKVMSSFIVTSQNGRATLGQIAEGLNVLSPMVSHFNITFTDLEASIALMSVYSSDTARNATSLGTAIMGLENPTGKSLAAMQKWGLGQYEIANILNTKGIAPALEKIKETALRAGAEGTAPYNRTLEEMLGITKRSGPALFEMIDHLGKQHDIQQKIATDYKTGAALAKGWAETQQTLQFQMQRFTTIVNNISVAIGTALLPYIKQFTAWLKPLIDSIEKWLAVGDNMKKLLIAIGFVAAGFAAVLAVVAIAVALATIIIIAFAVVVGGIAIGAVMLAIHIFQDWGKWTGWVGDRFNELGSTIAGWQKNTVGWFKQLDANVHGIIGGMVSWVEGRFNDLGSGMVNGVKNGVGGVVGAIQGMAGTIGGILSSLAGQAFSWGANLISGFIGGIFSKIGAVADAARQAAQAAASHLAIRSPAEKGPMSDADKWAPNLMNMLTNGIKAGTPAFQSALANVGAGGIGSPSSIGGAVGGGGSGRGGHMVKVVFEIDKREIASMVGSAMADEIRLNLGVR